MRFGRLILLAGLFLIIGLALMYVLTPEARNLLRTKTTISDQQQIDQLAIAFVGNPFTDDYGVMRVPGYVDNVSAQEMRAATVEIQLVDEDGNYQEKITYEVRDIVPNSRKTFDINAGTFTGKRDALISVVSLEVYQ